MSKCYVPLYIIGILILIGLIGRWVDSIQKQIEKRKKDENI
jgi:hypothetical protein